MVPTLPMVEKYQQWGLTCYPFEPGSKSRRFENLRYMTWGQYANIPQTPNEVQLLFSDHPDANIAIIGGRPSDNVFFLDADTPTEFDAISRILTGHGITTPIVQRDTFTGDDPHAGGGCFWLKAPEPVRSRRSTLGEIRGHAQYIIAPYSRHPTGPLYQFLNKPVEIFRLPSLDAIPELSLEPAPLTDDHRNIPRLALGLLNGDVETISHYQTRSEAECAIISSLYRAGFGFDMVLSYFYEYPAAGHFRERQQRDARDALRWLELSYRNVAHYLDAHPNNANAIAKRLEQWAISKPWPGRSGSTNRAVYLAHLAIVQRCGKADAYAASCRDLAELAGLSWQTVSKSNHRLVDDGLIELSDPHTPELANRWTLIDAVPSIDIQSPTHVTECRFMGQEQQHDAFRHSALGKTGAEIYYALRAMGRATPKQLQKATGRGRGTVYRKLELMETLMMVEAIEPREPGVYQALDVNLDAVANVLGTSGRGRRQRELHIQQRRRQKLELARSARAEQN